MREMEFPVLGKVKHPVRWGMGLIAVGSLAVGLATIYSFVNGTKSVEDISQLTVSMATENITLRIAASGKVVPVESVNISPKNPGLLARLYVEQGDSVQKGQVLAQMDEGEIPAQILQYRANLAQAEAQLAQARAGSRSQEIAQARARLNQAEAQLAQARAGSRSQEIAQVQAQVSSAQAQVNLTESRVERYTELTRQGAISQDQLEQYITENKRAKATLAEVKKRLSLLESGSRDEEIAARQAVVAEARAALVLLQNGSRPEEIAAREAAVKAAAAQVQGAQVRLRDTVIRAPFAGIVTQKYTNTGAFVTPTTSASSSASATSSSIVAVAKGLEIVAQVPEVDISRIRTGQKVEIMADAYPEEVFEGTVRLIAPEAVVEQGVTSFQVRVSINTGKAKLRSGLNVDLTFLGDRINDALVVPTVAIVTENGETGVLVADDQNKPEFREITIGAQIEDKTEILQGLEAGDRVFINPPTDYRKNRNNR